MPVFKKVFSLFLRIAISAFLLFLLFKQIDTSSLVANIRSTDKYILSIAFLIYFLTYIICLFRWEMLLKAIKINLPLKRVIISFAGGSFFSMFLPSTIGGDLIRSIDLSMHTKRPREVIATVLLDRLSGYIGLVIVAIVSIIIGWRQMDGQPVIITTMLVIVGMLVLILVVLFNNSIYSKVNKLLHSKKSGGLRDMIKNLHNEIYVFRNHKGVIINNIFMSVLLQITIPVSYYFIGLSFGIKINMLYYFIFIPIISAIAMLPISLGGLGLRDAATVFFFAKVGLGKDLAFAMSLTSFFIMVVYSIIGGLIYVLTVRHRRIQRIKPPGI
ncbi:MAG: UPF0104 family protein [Candidatus Omnitrophota bacterium]|nr:MAG: UPF0104 family protein [Candidatus Omnitrophota bacterium]